MGEDEMWPVFEPDDIYDPDWDDVVPSRDGRDSFDPFAPIRDDVGDFELVDINDIANSR